MSWKLDDILFSDYSVGVRKSSGVLDLPKLVDNGYDWLDVDSVDYWQDAADLRYNDSEIVLNCWIKAPDYTTFKSRLNTFYTAIKSADIRQLYTPFGITVGCYVEKEINVERKGSYLLQYQVGLFTLRFTVPGSDKFNLITVKRWTSAEGLTYPAVLKTSNLRVNKNLQGDITLSLTCESNEKLDINYEDWIDCEYDASHSDRFIINGEPQFTKNSSNKYVYSLSFEFKGINYLRRAQFLNDLGEADFSFYGNLDDLLTLIINNYGRRGYTSLYKGVCPSTINKNHKFSGENCLDVLRRMCTEYELEYEFEKNDPNWWEYTVNIKEKVATTKAVTFQYGKGNGLYKLNRGERIKDWYCTKLIAFGAAKNLPAGYRSGLRRLSFDGNPLYVPGVDPVEHTVFFDDIFPQRTGTVGSYTQVLPADLSDAQKEVNPGGIYQVVDTGLANVDPDYDLNINDYLLAGVTAKVVMKTGALAGYEFDIKRYDHDTQTIWIIPFTENDYTVPNAALQIAAGDEYTLINIDQPAGYIQVAEDALEAAAMEYLAEHSQPKFEYSVTVDPAYVAANSIYFEIGDEITVVDTDYGINGLFRISKLTFNDYTKVYELTLSDKTTYPRLQVMESAVKKLERAAQETGSSDVETMRDSQQTVGDLSRTLLDPMDERLNVDNIVRNNSLDPGMLALDAGYINARLKGALVECNVGGNEDAVAIGSGEFTLTNVNTLERYEMQKVKDDGGTYDPTRTWTIPQTNFTLANKNAWHLYARLNMAEGSTASTLLVSESLIEIKQDVSTGYLHYYLGTISAASSPRYAAMLFGNVKVPSPATVTEEIETAIEANNENTESGVPVVVKTILADYKEAYLIEDTTAASVTQESSWAVTQFNEQVGTFEAKAVITNKDLSTIVELKNSMGFDNSEGLELADDNTIVTDGTITLALAIDATSKKLKATVANMPTDAKRLYFCFERCILSARSLSIVADMGIPVEMQASLVNILSIQAGMSIPVEMAAALVDGNASGYEDVKYGYLYNFFAAADARNIANTGWHRPDYFELDDIGSYVSRTMELMDSDTTYWIFNTGYEGTNDYDLSLRGAGNREADGSFNSLRTANWLWAYYDSDDWYFEITNARDYHEMSNGSQNYGFSMRVIKDSLTTAEQALSDGDAGPDYVGNDGKVYPTIKLAGMIITKVNLKETKWRDGTSIPEVTNGTTWAGLSTGARCSYNNDENNA